MKRTCKRYSLKVNSTKWTELCQIARLYRDEKNVHLRHFNQDKEYYACHNERIQRDYLVKNNYKPDTNLQARQWKIALTEAHDTVHKYWTALAVELKPLISRHKGKWSEAEIHYAYWLAFSGKRLAEMVSTHNAPNPNHFKISYAERKRVRNYLRRVIRRKRGLRPVAKRSRSFIVDANMYSVIEKETGSLKNGKENKTIAQFIKIMGLGKGKRIVVPLTGYSNITGTIKIVLDFHKQRIEIHCANGLFQPDIDEKGATVALDAGITEVFTDDEGKVYEPTFGKTLTKASNQLLKTGKSRNKLHALRKKSSKHKAHRIRKFNLGKKKMKDRKRKGQIRVKQQISQAIHQVVKERKPAVIVTERLDIRGRAKSKNMSRLVSYWMRSALKERMSFLALAEGFRHQQVNPAYTSQMCPTCSFVHKGNRTGDRFQCLNCGHTDYADRIAAINLSSRYYDTEITIYTPKSVIKSILDKRFIASLESFSINSAETTVSGRTDTYSIAVSERNAVV